MSPVSGTPSPAQLAVMEQIRALRAAKTATPVQSASPVPSAAPVRAKPSAVFAAPAQSLTTASAASGPIPTNRPRGSILNITC